MHVCMHCQGLFGEEKKCVTNEGGNGQACFFFVYYCRNHRIRRSIEALRRTYLIWMTTIYYEQQLPPGDRRFRSRSHSLIIPEAQPTPASTVMALTGQFRAQAPHSIQASRSVMEVFFSVIENTWCGQTSRQRPQPMQVGWSS